MLNNMMIRTVDTHGRARARVCVCVCVCACVRACVCVCVCVLRVVCDTVQIDMIEQMSHISHEHACSLFITSSTRYLNSHVISAESTCPCNRRGIYMITSSTRHLRARALGSATTCACHQCGVYMSMSSAHSHYHHGICMRMRDG